jgi:hypothetical protein
MQEEPVLELVVNCLRSKRTWAVVGPEHYWNKYDLPGQYACYKEAETFLTISIHNCPTLIDVTTQADLIAGIEVIDEKRKGLYYNITTGSVFQVISPARLARYLCGAQLIIGS